MNKKLNKKNPFVPKNLFTDYHIHITSYIYHIMLCYINNLKYVDF